MSDLQVRGDVYAADMQKSLRTLAELTKKDVNQLVKDRAPTMFSPHCHTHSGCYHHGPTHY